MRNARTSPGPSDTASSITTTSEVAARTGTAPHKVAAKVAKMRGSMEDSMAYPSARPGPLARPAWMGYVSMISAVLLAILMLAAGLWKATDPINWSTRLHQALVPAGLSLPGTIALAIGETFSGVMLLVPRFRRWGAMLSGLLLIVFMIYVGANYSRLLGEDCSCFPWIERSVGPGFFVGDGAMLALALFAGLWAPAARSLKGALVVLAAVTVFAGASYGIAVFQQTGGDIQETILVDGEPLPLGSGRVLLFFFDPECSTCFFAARDLSDFTWQDVKIVGIPTVNPQFGPEFIEKTGLAAPLSSDIEKLRGMFEFGDPPYAVAIEDGSQLTTIGIFENPGMHDTLSGIGFVE